MFPINSKVLKCLKMMVMGCLNDSQLRLGESYNCEWRRVVGRRGSGYQAHLPASTFIHGGAVLPSCLAGAAWPGRGGGNCKLWRIPKREPAFPA